MDLSRLIIEDDHEFDRILESTNLDKYRLIDLPLEQPGDWSHKPMGVRMAPTLDTGNMSGLSPCEGTSTELCSGVDP